MCSKEPEMLQPDVFCEHIMQQNATAAEAPARTPLTELPRPLAGFKGAFSHRGGRGEGRERGRGAGMEGQGGGGEVDSDAQLV